MIFEMALRQGMISPRPPLARILVQTIGFTVLLLLFTYLMLRAGNLMR